MSNRKRFLAVVLAVMMVFSTMATMGVSAASNKFADVPTTNKELTQALSVLGDLEIVKGTGNDPETDEPLFSGDAPVTRQQFALFVARITTGTPAYFVPDENSPTRFDDVVDPTFFTAINHCVESGIINGYPDGSFKPNNPIQFQEAMKMLVTALGYTSLPYPQGYLSKATEYDVALIGRFVQTKGFEFANTGLTDELTRSDMAMLLYNFLLTNYYKLGSTWNGVTGQYEPITDRSPVISKFGITPYVGYVTAVQNYAMRIDVKDYNGTGLAAVFTGNPITERQADGTYTTNPRNLQISYADEGAITAAEKTAGAIAPASQKDLYVTYESIGMEKKSGEELLNQSLDLLGKKIIVYRHATLRAQTVNTALPAAVVVGEKTLITDNKANKVSLGGDVLTATNTIPSRKIGSVDELTLGTDNGTRTYNQRRSGGSAYGSNPRDLDLTYNLYAFTNNGYLVSDSGSKYESRTPSGTVTPEIPGYWRQDKDGKWEYQQPVSAVQKYSGDDLVADGGARASVNGDNDNEKIRTGSKLYLTEDSIVQELGKFIRGEGYYELYYVNNGVDREGLDEFYYIFIPYRAGVLHRKTDSYIDLRTRRDDNPHRVEGDLYSSTRTDKIKLWPGINEITVPNIADTQNLTNRPAYLYTYFGNHYKDLVIKDQLLQAATNVTVTEARNPSTSSARVTFAGTAYPSKEFTFNANYSKAIGAYQASDIVNSRFYARNTYHVYESAEEQGVALLSYETASPAKPNRTFKYGVIMSNTFVPVGYADGTTGFNYRVFNPETGKEENLILRPINGEVFDGGIGSNVKDLTGTFIGFIKLDDNSYETVIIGTNADNTLPDNAAYPSLATKLLSNNNQLRQQQPDNQNRYGYWNQGVGAGSVSELRVVGTRYNFSNSMTGGKVSAYTGSITGSHNNPEVLITDTTKVLVYSDDSKGDGSMQAGAGLYLGSNLPSGNVIAAGFVAGGDGTQTRVADMVFVRISGAIRAQTSRENYAIILNTYVDSNFYVGNQRYDVRKAYIYSTASIIDVAAPNNSDLLNVGRTVILGTELTSSAGDKARAILAVNNDDGTSRIATDRFDIKLDGIKKALGAKYDPKGTTTNTTTVQNLIANTNYAIDNLLAALEALEAVVVEPEEGEEPVGTLKTEIGKIALGNIVAYTDEMTGVNAASIALAYLTTEIATSSNNNDYSIARINSEGIGRVASAINTLNTNAVGTPYEAQLKAVATRLGLYRDSLIATTGSNDVDYGENNGYGVLDNIASANTYTIAGRVTSYLAGHSMRIKGNATAETIAGALTGSDVAETTISLVSNTGSSLPNNYRVIYVRATGTSTNGFSGENLLNRPGEWAQGNVQIAERLENSSFYDAGGRGIAPINNDWIGGDKGLRPNSMFAVVTVDKERGEPVAVTFIVGIHNNDPAGDQNNSYNLQWR